MARMTNYVEEGLLPDLRPTIAEILEGLAMATAKPNWRRPYDEVLCRLSGAQTLRWCAAREAPSAEELQGEIGRLDDIIQAVYDALHGEDAMGVKLSEIRGAVSSW